MVKKRQNTLKNNQFSNVNNKTYGKTVKASK